LTWKSRSGGVSREGRGGSGVSGGVEVVARPAAASPAASAGQVVEAAARPVASRRRRVA